VDVWTPLPIVLLEQGEPLLNESKLADEFRQAHADVLGFSHDRGCGAHYEFGCDTVGRAKVARTD
jgi:hypothetical protein